MFAAAFFIMVISFVCFIISVFMIIAGTKEWYETKEHNLFISGIGCLILSGLVYSTTFNDRHNYVLEKTLDDTQIKSEFNMFVTSIVTKHGGYNKYFLVNKINGDTFYLTEADNIKFNNCYNWKLEIYNYYRYYDIVGVTHSEPKTEKMYKIVCKGE